MHDVVQASNALTRAWLTQQAQNQETETGSFVLSGSGVWSILAVLTAGASGPARHELASAIGIDAGEARGGANWMIDLLTSEKGLAAALGIWTARTAPIRQDFAEQFPQLTLGGIPANASDLDSWAHDRTNGLVDKFPATINHDTLMVLATAVVADDSWRIPFSGSRLLFADFADLDLSAILTTEEAAVGRVVCQSQGAFDVHLLSGDETLSPEMVLHVGIDAATNAKRVVVRSGSVLEAGESAGRLGVRIAPGDDERLVVSVPSFDLQSEWDLLPRFDLFGLGTASDASRGHFDVISPMPLAVESGSQSAMAGCSNQGFRAAAVSAVMAVAAGMPPRPENSSKRVDLDLDAETPFGFLAVHRDTGLVLFAGWFNEPLDDTPIPVA